jgi:argininosuccinate synthase
MVDIANEVGADAVSHGCTGKGNDQACIIIISLSHQFIYPCVFF